jgi:hypothetical protein
MSNHYALNNNSVIVTCLSLMSACDTCSDNVTCTSCINQSYILSAAACSPCTTVYNNVNCVICDATYCL